MCRNAWWRNLIYVGNFEFNAEYIDNAATVSRNVAIFL
jgi:hypothetical protein